MVLDRLRAALSERNGRIIHPSRFTDDTNRTAKRARGGDWQSNKTAHGHGRWAAASPRHGRHGSRQQHASKQGVSWWPGLFATRAGPCGSGTEQKPHDGRSAARRGSAEEEDARRPRALWHAPVNRDAGACTRARRYPEGKGSTGAPRNHAPTCSLGSPAVRASRQGRRALPSRQPSLSQVSPILPVQVQVQPSCPKNKHGSHHLPFQNPDWKWAMKTVQIKQSGGVTEPSS